MLPVGSIQEPEICDRAQKQKLHFNEHLINSIVNFVLHFITDKLTIEVYYVHFGTISLTVTLAIYYPCGATNSATDLPHVLH